MLKQHWLALMIAAGCGLALSAGANDTSVGFDNGTIAFAYQPDITLDRESLRISERQIQVDYVFTNRGDRDLSVPVAFPMPPLYLAADGDYNTIEDFRLWVNGQPQPTEKRLAVVLEDRTDISMELTRSGWTVDDLAQFVEQGNVPSGKPPLPLRWFDLERQPRFTATEYFLWTQDFPVGQAVAIRHTYRPSLTTGVPWDADSLIAEYGDSACIDPSTRAGIKKRAGDTGVSWNVLRYILKTANNWRDGIRNFTLTIDKQRPTDLVSLCFDGELKKIDPVTFQFHQVNYRPAQDLQLLFVR